MVLPLLFGALAPSIFTGINPLLAASLGAGVGGAVESGDLETGLLTGLGAFAGGSLLGPMLRGAGAAGAAGAAGSAGAAGAAGAGGAGAAGTAAQAARAAAAASAANPAAAGAAAASAANPAAVAAQPGGLMSLFRGPAPGSTASILGTAGKTAASAATGGGGMIQNAMNFAKSPVGMGVGIGSMAGPALAGMIGSGEEKGKSKYSGVASKEMKPLPKEPGTPGPDYQPGVSPEFNYGIGTVPTASQIIDFRDKGALRYSDGGLLRRYQQMMGPVRMAEGGIASLAEMEGEEGQVAASTGGNEKDVISAAVAAIKGQSQNPQMALAAFLSTYGEDALRDLVDRVQSGEFDQNAASSNGKMTGPGDGMQDMIPASIDGQQDVLLSDGEYVVPADVVSHLGNGSSDAGARLLDEMAARARQARTGTAEQPARVPQQEMLPV